MWCARKRPSESTEGFDCPISISGLHLKSFASGALWEFLYNCSESTERISTVFLLLFTKEIKRTRPRDIFTFLLSLGRMISQVI